MLRSGHHRQHIRTATRLALAAAALGCLTAAAPPEIKPETMVRVPAPKQGRNRCIDVSHVAGAIVFGDLAVELTLRSGKRWRLTLAQSCPTLSFYQGFYYRRSRAGKLCAGRDTIIARSGGECAIISIMPVPRPPAKSR